MRTAADLAIAMSSASLGVSAWAALTAHRSRVWQRQRDEERRATTLRIEFIHSSAYKKGVRVVALGQPPPPRAIRYSLTTIVINAGETTEYVTGVFLEAAGKGAIERDGLRIFGNEGHEPFEPRELQPRARLAVTQELAPSAIEWLRDGFTAEVRLASGTRERSDMTQLQAEHLDKLT